MCGLNRAIAIGPRWGENCPCVGLISAFGSARTDPTRTFLPRQAVALRAQHLLHGVAPERRWMKADAKRVPEVRWQKPWAGSVAELHDVAERWPEHALSEATVARILHWVVEAEGEAARQTRWCSSTTSRRTSTARRSRSSGRSAPSPGGSTPGYARASRRTQPGRSSARPWNASTPGACRRTAARSSCATCSGARSFEADCKKRGLDLLVLPPRSPELNGIVERANRAVRVECWSQYRDDIFSAAMNGMRTPAEFATTTAMAACPLTSRRSLIPHTPNVASSVTRRFRRRRHVHPSQRPAATRSSCPAPRHDEHRPGAH